MSDSHCAGKPSWRKNCFEFSEDEFPEGPLEYFKTYPIIKILLDAGNEKDPVEFHWYPSEYLYKQSYDTYCLAADSHNREKEIWMGGTFMRQHNFIFDLDNNRLGL